LRRIFVRPQGAPRGAYYLYVTFGATRKADKKTSKIADLFVSEALTPDIDRGQIHMIFAWLSGC